MKKPRSCITEDTPDGPGAYWERLDAYEEEASEELERRCGKRHRKRTRQVTKSGRRTHKRISRTDPEAGHMNRPGKPHGPHYLSHQTLDTDHGIILGATVTAGDVNDIPYEVTKIAVSGPLSQVYVIPLAGDMLVGVSNAFSQDAARYLPDYILTMTEVGQLYGGKGEMDLEALLLAAPDVVIDVGDAKDTIAEDMDSLTQQTGIPFVHIDATVDTAPAAYRKLGELTGRTEKAEELAVWCENTLKRAEDLMARVDADGARKTLLYCLGDAGVNVIARGSFHGDTVNLMGDNLAVVPEVVSSGAGNEVDLEQIMLWDPEVILFDPDSIYDAVGDAAEWQSVTAVAEGRYYKTPYGPYGWLSSPPAVQRYLGLLWLGALLYPDYVDYDLQEEVTEYYRLFYGCELTDEMYRELTAGALD